MVCYLFFSSLNSKLGSSGEHSFSLELQSQKEVTGGRAGQGGTGKKIH